MKWREVKWLVSKYAGAAAGIRTHTALEVFLSFGPEVKQKD